MNISDEIQDIFKNLETNDSSEVLDYIFPDYPDDANMHLIKYSQKDTVCGRTATLGEIFLEWYLFDSSTRKDIKQFLTTENLVDVFTEKEFADLMCGDAHLDDSLLLYIQQKLPFYTSFAKLQWLNTWVIKNNPSTYLIQATPSIITKTQELIDQQNEEKRRKRAEYSRKCNEKHRPQRLAYKKWYRETHKEELKAANDRYNETHREERRAYSRQYYITNLEKVKESQKKSRAAHHEHIAAYDKQYRATHPEKIRQIDAKRRQKFKQNHEAAQKICAAYVFLIQLRKTNFQKYLELYTRNQKPLTSMLKMCPALQSMDINMCPLCNPNCENDVCKCCNQKVLPLPNALDKIQIIANELMQKAK